MDASLQLRAEQLANEIASQARTAEDLNGLMRLMKKAACFGHDAIRTDEAATEPSNLQTDVSAPYVANACAIEISDFVRSSNEPEKSSIGVQLPRLTWVRLNAGSQFVIHFAAMFAGNDLRE